MNQRKRQNGAAERPLLLNVVASRHEKNELEFAKRTVGPPCWFALSQQESAGKKLDLEGDGNDRRRQPEGVARKAKGKNGTIERKKGGRRGQESDQRREACLKKQSASSTGKPLRPSNPQRRTWRKREIRHSQIGIYCGEKKKRKGEGVRGKQR